MYCQLSRGSKERYFGCLLATLRQWQALYFATLEVARQRTLRNMSQFTFLASFVRCQSVASLSTTRARSAVVDFFCHSNTFWACLWVLWQLWLALRRQNSISCPWHHHSAARSRTWTFHLRRCYPLWTLRVGELHVRSGLSSSTSCKSILTSAFQSLRCG